MGVRLSGAPVLSITVALKLFSCSVAHHAPSSPSNPGRVAGMWQGLEKETRSSTLRISTAGTRLSLLWHHP